MTRMQLLRATGVMYMLVGMMIALLDRLLGIGIVGFFMFHFGLFLACIASLGILDELNGYTF